MTTGPLTWCPLLEGAVLDPLATRQIDMSTTVNNTLLQGSLTTESSNAKTAVDVERHGWRDVFFG